MIDMPLIVTDTRANVESGWHVTASLSTPMRNNEGKELINALRFVYNGQEEVLNTNAQMIYSNNSSGVDNINISDNWGTEAGTDGVKFQIDARDIVHTGRFEGVVTWKVMAGQP
ncbi:hypothetical protein C240_732 [Enterococcus sp. 5H]|nr:hypothetical protein [Enterococcus sp. 5H]